MEVTDQTEKFLAVLQSHKGIIYKVVRSYCADPDDREDLVQDIVFQLWKSFDSYSDEYQYSTWIYRIALNVAISNYRKESRQKSLLRPLSESTFSFADPTFVDDWETNLGLLQQFIGELKDLDKALLLLYLDEKSQKEMAEIMGISETNISTRINRIKEILKKKLSNVKS